MTDQLTATGLEIDDLETRTNAMIAELRSTISPSLELSIDTAEGQFARIFAERVQSIADLLQAVHGGQYPASAIGFGLSQLSALTGTIRKAATYTTISNCEVQLEAAATLPIGSVAHIVNAPNDTFLVTSAITGSDVTGWFSCSFSAENAGPTQALISTLDSIAEPVTGWLAVRNNAAGTTGRSAETDVELRARRTAELQTGSTSTGAIATALSQLTGMEWVQVIENATDSVDANGNPAHSVHAITYSGGTVTEQAIASTILTTKAGGIEAYGSAIATVEDPVLGTTHSIGYSVAETVELYVDVFVEKDETNYDGDTEIEDQVQVFGSTYLGVGDEVVISRLSAHLFSNVTGILDITEIRVSTADPPLATVNYETDWNKIAELDSTRVTVTST